MQDLKYWFEKAGLDAKVYLSPMDTSVRNTDIFQMSISFKGKKRRREYFQVYSGAPDNDVRIIDADKDHKQVVLLVHEPKRQFCRTVWSIKKQKYVEELQTTPEFIRKYLCGMDESHYFIAELPTNVGAINKVKQAHKVLKPKEIAKNEKRKGRIKRQGEWFFIPASMTEIEEIEGNKKEIKRKKRMGDGWGNAHVAEQIIDTEYGSFVSGNICHIEHKTLKLHGWFKVIKNTESRSSSAGRYNWID